VFSWLFHPFLEDYLPGYSRCPPLACVEAVFVELQQPLEGLQ